MAEEYTSWEPRESLTQRIMLGLGVIMILHRSIWPAVLAHGFFNATTFALLPLIARPIRPPTMNSVVFQVSCGTLATSS